MIAAIERLMEYDTAGDPITGLRWTRKTTEKIARELGRLHIHVSSRTVSRLLRGLKFSLRVNHKRIATGSSPDRDRQFRNIQRQRQRFERKGDPIVSVDTKKRELVGNFKNPGSKWDRNPVLVQDHDFRSDSAGVAIPYGIYDLHANRGFVCVGTSHNTPAFAVHSIARWWRKDGYSRYPRAKHLLILADTGGSNGYRCHGWKLALQTQLSDPFGLTVTVAHYPTGASKWNPVEHRLFSEISKNWAGEPLTSYAKILNFIRTTRTDSGLRVRACLDEKHYSTKAKPTRKQTENLQITPHRVLPKWNYTLAPHGA